MGTSGLGQGKASPGGAGSAGSAPGTGARGAMSQSERRSASETPFCSWPS